MSDTRATPTLDTTDLEILEHIETDYDVSLETIADAIGVSKSAVHYRIQKLQDAGVITGVTADVDPAALGLDMTAITDVMVTHEENYADTIGEQLAEIPGITQVYYTMGDVDFVVVSRVQDRDQLNMVIDDIVAIEGVNETSSRFVLQEFQPMAGLVANLSTEMRTGILNTDD